MNIVVSRMGFDEPVAFGVSVGRRVLLLLLAACGFCACAGAPAGPACKPLPERIAVDRAWGGVAVGFDAIQTQAAVFVGYFDDERWLAVSRVDKCSGAVRKVRLASRFGGWDTHNAVALALDGAGRLHLAGNMHVSPLVYARMAQADALESLAGLQPMTRLEEERATYPNFFRFPDGALGFSYRYGRSGDGRELINRFDGRQWVRWIDSPLFAPASAAQPVNAYHTGFVPGPDGYFHVAWVWRENFRVETNFDVNYARSRDLKTWENSRGEAIGLPLTPANAEVVDRVAKGGGLFNNIRLGFDAGSDAGPDAGSDDRGTNAKGRVVISYLKFDAQGHSQLFHARRGEAGWELVQSTRWTYRWNPRGGGTIPSEISFSGVSVRKGELVERVRQPEIGSVIFKYGAQTLALDAVRKAESWEPGPSVKRDAVKGAIVNARPVRESDGKSSSRHAISWLSHPADNRDKPRDCKPVGLPCDFVSELMLHTRGAEVAR